MDLNLKQVIGLIFGIILIVAITAFFYLYMKNLDFQKFAIALKQIQQGTEYSINENGYTLTNCQMESKPGIYIVKPKETMLAKKWIGLSSDTTDCSLSVLHQFNKNLLDDELRLYIEPVGDVTGIKLIWKDNNENGIPDVNERLGYDFKDTLENYLKSAIPNSL